MTARRYAEGGVTFDKRRQLWVGTVELPAQPGGPERPRKRVTAKTREAMLQKMRDVQHAKDRGLPVTNARLTTGDWLQHWLDTIAPARLKGATSLDRYQRCVRVHLIPHLGRIPLAQLQPEHVESMMIAMSAEGSSAGTVAKVRTILRRALTVAEQRGKVTRNVAALTDPPETSRKTSDRLTAAEAEAVMAVANGERPRRRGERDLPLQRDRLAALSVCALYVGFRQHELLDLRWSDVDLRAGTVRVVKAKTKAGVRIVPLPDVVLDALRDHRARQRRERIAADVWGDPDLVFASTVGTRIGARNCLRWWHRLTIDAGVGRRRFHASRHTAATLMLNRGVALEVISKILGHSHYAITADIYAQIDPDTLRSGAAAIDGLIAERADSRR